jgi:transposase
VTPLSQIQKVESPKFPGRFSYGKIDWNARGRTNVIGALLNNQLMTLCTFQSTIDSKIFNAWVTQDLLPKTTSGVVIVMDNASFHKKEATHIAIEEAGCTLEFLPTYSPDLNPIEHKWAQAKAIRRKLRCSVDEIFQLCTI